MQLKIGHRALVAAAEAEIETLTAAAAQALVDDDDALFVDIRDPRELSREGTIPGALHAPRGMLEFWVDPESPYYREAFGSGKRLVLFCQSGWRSALATQTLQRMGVPRVCHIGGGYRAWQDAGGVTETVER